MAGSAGSVDGTGSAARFSTPRSIAVDAAGDVYVAERRQFPLESNVNYDELTIWRSFTVEWPDGSLSSTVCSYRTALVYRRQK